MNNEIIKIGKAAKWRGTYDDSLTYYQENQVTLYGCVFSCKAEKVTSKPPVVVSNAETGSIQLANTDIWDCMVNAIDFYNRALNGVPFDTTPQEGSNNGVTSGATYDAIRRATDPLQAQIDAINLGAKLTMTIAPNVIFRDVPYRLTLIASINSIVPQNINITDDTAGGDILVQGSDVAIVSHVMEEASFNVNNVFRGTALYMGASFTSSVTLHVVDKLLFGSSKNASQITANASPRTSPAGTYSVETANDNDYIWFFVPYTMSAINKATLNGFDFPLSTMSPRIIDGVKYRVYRSANTYLKGTRSIVIS